MRRVCSGVMKNTNKEITEQISRISCVFRGKADTDGICNRYQGQGKNQAGKTESAQIMLGHTRQKCR